MPTVRRLTNGGAPRGLRDVAGFLVDRCVEMGRKELAVLPAVRIIAWIRVRYQIPSGEESGTVRAAGAESSRRFLPHVAMVKATDTWQSDNFRAG